MISIFCYNCISKDDIIQYKNNYFCKKCKILLKKCDICDLYCNDMCLDIFTKSLKL